jgi:hypothetical protein
LIRRDHEFVAAFPELGDERFGHPGGVDVAGRELGRGVREGDLDELDLGGVAAVLLDRCHDRDVAGRTEAVDRHLAPGELGRSGDAGFRRCHHRIDVVTVGVGRGIVADDHDTEVLQIGPERPERLTDGEIDVTVDQRRNGLCATLGG